MKHPSFAVLAASAAILSQPAFAEEVLDLDEIVITATAQPIEKQRTGTSVEVLGEDGSVGESGDVEVTSALKRLPGVTSQQNGPLGTTTNVSIRGAQERYSAVYVDGIKVNDPSSTSGQYGNFGGFTIGGLDRIEVLKGSQSALHGSSAVAGVINVFTLPDLDGPEGKQQRAEFLFGSYGTFAGSYSLNQNHGDLSLSFGASHAQSDGFSAGDENLGNTEADGFRSTRLSFGLAYQATDTLRVGVNGFVSDGRADFDEGAFGGPVDGTPGDESGARTERGLRAFAEFDGGGAWQHQVSASYFNVDRSQESLTVAPGSFGSFSSQFEGERRRMEWQSNAKLSERLSLSLGADYEKLTSTDTAIPGGTASIHNRGVFAEAVYSPSENLDVIGTLRYDDNSQFDSATTGKLAVSYRPNDALTLRGAVATGFRAPVPSELYSAYPDPLYPYFGNPDLAPEESQSVEIGFDYALSDATAISATAFRNGIENLVQFQSCPYVFDSDLGFWVCAPDSFSTVVNTPGTSTYKGLEFNLEHRFSDDLGMTLAYTYLDAKTAAGARLPRVAEHELYLSLEVAITDRLDGQLAITHVAGRPPETSPAQVMPDYTVVDLIFEYELSEAATAYLSVHNVLDEQYQQIAGYGTSGRAVFAGLRARF